MDKKLSLRDALEKEKNKAPECDVLHCYECNKTFNLAECHTMEDGTWETGYYTYHVCPNDWDHDAEYSMSEAQLKRWEEWEKQNVHS